MMWQALTADSRASGSVNAGDCLPAKKNVRQSRPYLQQLLRHVVAVLVLEQREQRVPIISLEAVQKAVHDVDSFLRCAVAQAALYKLSRWGVCSSCIIQQTDIGASVALMGAARHARQVEHGTIAWSRLCADSTALEHDEGDRVQVSLGGRAAGGHIPPLHWSQTCCRTWG